MQSDIDDARYKSTVRSCAEQCEPRDDYQNCTRDLYITRGCVRRVCCQDDDLCNSAGRSTLTGWAVLLIGVGTAAWAAASLTNSAHMGLPVNATSALRIPYSFSVERISKDLKSWEVISRLKLQTAYLQMRIIIVRIGARLFEGESLSFKVVNGLCSFFMLLQGLICLHHKSPFVNLKKRGSC
ncbi:hypothetical protein ElyMa_002541300 [Elysia marginata]|uniref:Uncharacterized protein n=1 Tax=Elysia marginata TaxID=1093978 RepID=A0AAV4GUI2_9GAST|nr:hypothetical protein ElyMa_002541300 [Elysia marginata]